MRKIINNRNNRCEHDVSLRLLNYAHIVHILHSIWTFEELLRWNASTEMLAVAASIAWCDASLIRFLGKKNKFLLQYSYLKYYLSINNAYNNAPACLILWYLARQAVCCEDTDGKCFPEIEAVLYVLANLDSQSSDLRNTGCVTMASTMHVRVLCVCVNTYMTRIKI